MSLQDDIFDVMDALPSKQLKGAFERITDRFAALEQKVEIQDKILSAIGRGEAAKLSLAKLFANDF